VKVQITHMKAPWHSGAVVGDVLEFDAVPVWAVGKCKPVDDGSDSIDKAPSSVDTDESKAAASLAEAEAQAAQEKAAIQGHSKKRK
jgi:hypothetical protein